MVLIRGHEYQRIFHTALSRGVPPRRAYFPHVRIRGSPVLVRDLPGRVFVNLGVYVYQLHSQIGDSSDRMAPTLRNQAVEVRHDLGALVRQVLWHRVQTARRCCDELLEGGDGSIH